MDGTVLKLPINLKSFSAVTVATNLWEHEDIKPKIREYFEDAKINDQKSPLHLLWQNIVKTVSDHANSLSLPIDLQDLLQDIIILIGEKIFYWNLYVLRNLDLLHEYTYKIYFTQFGTIDESKIFNNHWAPISEEGLTRVIMKNNDLDIYFLACALYQQSYLEEHFENMLFQTRLFLAPVRIPSQCNMHTLMIVWLCAFLTNNKQEALKMYKKIKNSNSTDVDMFFICVDHAFINASKYFWDRLSQRDRENVIVEAAEKCLANFDKKEIYEEKSVEILIFLINNMSANMRNKFLSENIKDVFRMFMNSWPFQDMFLKIIDKLANNIDVRHKVYLLTFTTSCIIGKVKTERYASKNLWRQILPLIFKKFDRDCKIVLVTTGKAFPIALFEKFDIPMLTLILNDEDLADYKEHILKLGIPKFKKLIKERNFLLVNKLLQNVLPKPKRKEFKLKIDVLPEIITDEDYELADEVINWLADSEEKIQIKNQIDLTQVFPDFKNFKCELNKLFSWKNNATEERGKTKQNIKDQKFIRDKIIRIWNEKGENGKLYCFEFLKSVFKTPEEEIEFKKNLKIDEELIKKFCESLPSPASFKRIDKLFQFLSITPGKILKVKEKMIENIDEWINLHAITQRNFYLAHAIVTWMFKDKNQMADVMGKYINSSDGAKFLVKTVATFGTVDHDTIFVLFNSWVKSYGNINKIKKELDLIKHDNFTEFWSFICLKNLLDSLAQSGRVKKDVIDRWLFKKMEY